MESHQDEYTALIRSREGREGTDTSVGDHLSFREACRNYRLAIFWSIFFSLGTVMIAFNNQIIANLLATPAFRRAFGYQFGDEYVVAASWQTGLYLGSTVGQVVMCMLITYPLDYLGRKTTFGLCTVVMPALVYAEFVARTPSILLVAELLAGLTLGAYALMGPLYAAEVCPVALRGVLTAYTQLCWVLGQLLANIVTKIFSEREDAWAFRGPFAVQWILPLIILIGFPFAPESPWFLASKGRLDEAQSALEQLSSFQVDSKKELEIIVETIQMEQKTETSASYMDCFRSVNRRRTEIAVGVYSSQVLSGNYMIGYGTYFFELAGLPTKRAFEMGVGFLGVGLFGSCFAWFLILNLDRRIVEIWGTGLLALTQLVVGLLDVSKYTPSIAWGQSLLMLLWNLIYNVSIGSFAFVIMCECSSTQLRSKTIAIATAIQASISIGMTFLVPYLVNPDQLNLRGKFGFIFAVLGGLCCLWTYIRVPETKNRTYEELDIMFEMQVPTSDFKNFRIPNRD